MAPLPVFHRPQSVTSHETSLSSSRTIAGDCNSSGNSGSGGSVSIGTRSFMSTSTNNQQLTSDYIGTLGNHDLLNILI